MGILQRQEKDNVQVLLPSVVHIGTGDRERRLVKRLRSGDAGALQDFYALYSGSMSSVCGRYITDRDDMKDVLQECLIRIAEKIADFEYRGPGSLRAWVTRIVINQSLKYLKTRQAVRRKPDDGTARALLAAHHFQLLEKSVMVAIS